MNKNIFGSTCSLGALFNDSLNDSETDQFLQDLGTTSKGFEFLPPPGAEKLDVLTTDSALLSEQVVSEIGNQTAISPSAFPALPASLSQAWPASGKTQAEALTQPAADTLNLLAQLISLAQKGTIGEHQQSTQLQDTTKLLFQCKAALKPTAAPVQQFAPVTQVTPTQNHDVVTRYPHACTLPSMTAEQQQVIHNILSVGGLGTSTEGKKVRRMLSNRESARRSRHRKQAHVKEVEERSTQLEVENERMKAALAGALEQQEKAIAECGRLQVEIAALQAKVAKLERCPAHSKANVLEVRPEAVAKRGTSNGSTAGHTSEDSCCESMPAKTRPLEIATSENHCCKRCCLREAA